MKTTKVLSLLLMTVLMSTPVLAQKKKEDAPAVAPTKDAPAVEVYKGIYHSALKYNDLTTASNAVFNILALAPDQTKWKDTLAYLYYNDGRYVQALLVGNEIIEKNDTSQNIMEIVAISQQNLGLIKESLESYEKLYKLSKSIFHQYKIATLQYGLKRFGECGATIAQIMQNKDNTQQIAITDNNRKQENVSIKAAVLNLSGVIAMEVNQPDAAKKNFEDALKAEPNFELAKNNLTAISKTKDELKTEQKAEPKAKAAPKN